MALTGCIVPVVNEEIVTEYREVLKRPKFLFTDGVICDVMENIERRAAYIDMVMSAVHEEVPDPKEQVFYEIVIEERKTEDAYLVTGNLKHFPKKTFIVTPRGMLDMILTDAA